MYICIHVHKLMHTYIYVDKYVCMHAHMDVTFRHLCGKTYMGVFVCMHVLMYLCMHVCMNTCVCFHVTVLIFDITE